MGLGFIEDFSDYSRGISSNRNNLYAYNFLAVN